MIDFELKKRLKFKFSISPHQLQKIPLLYKRGIFYVFLSQFN
jgi:hypothetical protein